jgi:multidrug efflux pump subunit AcrA (membrane-fusion protein)
MSPTSKRAEQAGLDKESNLLPNDPPHWLVRGSAWLVIALFAAILVASVIVHVPETIRCPCVLVPEAGADPIQSPRRAVVRQVRVAEGRQVAAGDELFVLSSEEIGDLDVQERTLGEDMDSRQQDLKRSETADAADLDMKDHEIAQADDEVRFRQSTVAVERDLAARVEKLQKLGIYSETDLILRRLEVEGSEKDLSVAERSRELLKLQRKQMADEQTRIHSGRTSEINKLGIHLDSLKRELQDSNQGLISIRAPYDAVVLSLSASNPGSVVQSGQELCQLGRADGMLKVRLLLPETGLPRLAVGQRIRFFADAFPYQRYGTLSGTLTWISPSAVVSRDGQQFIALASLDRNSFSSGDRAGQLRVGMRGEARIVVGSRTLIEYALEPVRQLTENLASPTR